MLNARRRLDALEDRIGAVEKRLADAPEGMTRLVLDGAQAAAVLEFLDETDADPPVASGRPVRADELMIAECGAHKLDTVLMHEVTP
jgi:hypothetical protein